MIDINKKYRTRDGREVRIYATDGGQCGTLIHGAVFDNAFWGSLVWNSDGSKYSWREDSLDLIKVRPRHKRTLWVNVYEGDWDAYTAASKEDADENASDDRIACIKVELDFAEGDGL